MADFIDGYMDAAVEHVVRAAEGFFRYQVGRSRRDGLMAQAQSPLEELFALWWAVVTTGDSIHKDIRLVGQTHVKAGGQNYRLDFSVEAVNPLVSASKKWQPIGIELDGHAFHERTPAQVRTRDSRDRALASEGWLVLHFSFSEFTNNPYACMQEVLHASVRSLSVAIFDVDPDGKLGTW